MADSSALGTFRAALKADLQGRTPALSGVQVRSFPPAADDLNAAEGIYFADADVDQQHLAMGRSRLETGLLEIVVWARKPGDGDTIAAATEDRALVLFGEVEEQLKDDESVSSSVMASQLLTYTVEAQADQGHRITLIRAQVQWRVRLEV